MEWFFNGCGFALPLDADAGSMPPLASRDSPVALSAASASHHGAGQGSR